MWSTMSGTLLGVFLDVALIGAAYVVGAMTPIGRYVHRMDARWTSAAAALVLIAIPLVLSILGYLEGQLKTV